MPVSQTSKLGEDLKETLSIGNFTGDGQQIVPENGNGGLDLRNMGTDNVVVLTNNFDGSLAYLSLTPGTAQLGFNAAAGLYMDFSSTEAFFRSAALTTYFAFSAANGGLRSLALQGGNSFNFVIVENASQNRTEGAINNTAIFINSGGAGAQTTINQNISNTVAVGGRGITAKTSNTIYTNQLSFQENGISFDCILKSGTITADQTVTMPNRSGVMGIGYQERWTQYNATLTNTWETITIADAIPNSEILILVCNDTNNDTYGIRKVGSILDRVCPLTSANSVEVTTFVDSNKQIQVKTTDPRRYNY
jgi:hypothetical protein